MSSVRRKSSKRAIEISAKHAIHSDQASLAALRCSTQRIFTLALLFLVSQRHYTGLLSPERSLLMIRTILPHKGQHIPQMDYFLACLSREHLPGTLFTA